MEKEFKLKDVSIIAKKILDLAKNSKKNKATIITLSGELGAGKTRLTQEIGKLLSISERIISPTFVIMKIYKIKSSCKYYPLYKRLVHIDAYRLNSSDELNILGWEEIISDVNNLIILEWPERVKECLKDKDVCALSIKHIDDQTRIIKFLI